MSLVAYADSEESGIESEDEESSGTTAIDKKAPANISEGSVKGNDDSVVISDAVKTPVKTALNDGKQNLNSMPAAPKSIHLPSSHATSINFDMKILDKNRSQPIRITIPSLKDVSWKTIVSRKNLSI